MCSRASRQGCHCRPRSASNTRQSEWWQDRKQNDKLATYKTRKKEILKNIAAGSFVKDFGLGKVWWSAFKA